MLEFISSKKNTEETPFGITGVRTEPGNDLRVNPIVEIGIDFMLERSKLLV